MSIFILVFLFIVLFSIAFQDFKSRLVDVFSLGIFCVLSISFSYIENSIGNLFNLALLPIIFIIFQLLVLTILYSLKAGKLTLIFDTKLGWGDIVFWLGLCFLFSIFNYILFFILSIVFVVIFSFFKKLKTIPLAGGQAIVLSFFLFLNHFFLKIDTYDDLYFINLLF